MAKINSQADVRAAILLLELKQAEEGKLLKEKFHQAIESMKPVNLIKSTIKEVASSEELKDTLINTSIGLATGYLSKVLFEKVTHSPLRKLLGTALQFGVTTVVAKHPDAIKSMGNGLLNIIKKATTKKTAEDK